MTTKTKVPTIIETLLSHDTAEAEAYEAALELLAGFTGPLRIPA